MKLASIERISLNARSNATLDWHEGRALGLKTIAAGKKVLWHLEFGLFRDLAKSLADKSQFLNFCLALDHFRDTIWKEFERFSVGVLLYRIPGHFIKQIPCDDTQDNNLQQWLRERFDSIEALKREINFPLSAFENVSFDVLYATESGQMLLHLFTRDVALDYLEQLAQRLPQTIPVFVDFDPLPQERWMHLMLTHPEIYRTLQITQNPWNLESEAKIGICMPSPSVIQSHILAPFKAKIHSAGIKWIPEELLTINWDGLDFLYYSPSLLSSRGLRKIQGFMAAGGKLIEI